MYKKRHPRVLRLLAASILLALSACASNPPVQEMSDARQAIQAAISAGAEKYAELALEDARKFLADAEANLQRKAYNGAKNDARESRRWAEVAINTAVEAAGTEDQ